MTAERLHKIISAAGLASRREAEKWIAAGRVRVDGEPVTRPGAKADPERSLIEVDGRRIEPRRRDIWLALHKPRGYLTTAKDPRGRPTVFDLLGGAWASRGERRVFYVGRLDMYSEGLLLLTSDGELAHRLTHPSRRVPRRYRLQLESRPGAEEIERLRRGVRLEDGPARVERATLLGESGDGCWLEVEVCEGRNRLLRRLLGAIGHRVLRLVRLEYAGVKLSGLEPGCFRPLRDAERRRLRRAAGALEGR